MLSSSSLGAQLTLTCSPNSSKLPSFVRTNSFHNSVFLRLNPSPFNFYMLSDLKISRHTRQRASPTASPTITAADDSSTAESEKLGVVVNLMEKPRVVLKFIWMDRNLGLALEQVIPGHGSIPLGPYYFWPRKDALGELKMMLESKPWISQKQAALLLNQATHTIDMWQQRS